MYDSPISRLENESAVKPLKRSERLRNAVPKKELPNREELVGLFEKYDVQAPRYTSYPPATHFTETFDESTYLDHITSVSYQSDRTEISLYVHLPFCDTLCYFCGCTMLVSNNREKISEYLEYLKKEITLVRESLEYVPIVVQMHWGGGSPTHLLPKEIADLGAHLRQTFVFSPLAEVSIEIDPRGVTEEHISAMKSVGFNRASIGVQDFNTDVQLAINRMQPRSVTEQVIEWCRAAGIESINLDLIYGLPYQTTTSFVETLKVVGQIAPDRIAIYSFAYVPWIKPHQNLIPIELLPVNSTKLALLELAIRNLTTQGYKYLGMDHFAKPEDALVKALHSGTLHRNFQGYSTNAGKDLLAFGISGISRVENSFGQNVKELPAYYSMVAGGHLPIEKGYALTADDQLREYVIMQVMCNSAIQKDEINRMFGIEFDSYFREELSALEDLERDGLCQRSPDSIEVTPIGRFFLRNIASVFDAYLPASGSERQFSRAV